MALPNNPTPAQLVKEVKSLDTNKQNTLPTTSTAGKVLKSTSTAGTVEWGNDNSTDVQVDSTSITNGDIANLKTINGNYNASSNKIATKNDLTTVTFRVWS